MSLLFCICCRYGEIWDCYLFFVLQWLVEVLSRFAFEGQCHDLHLQLVNDTIASPVKSLVLSGKKLM